jgi:hypothetical protein
MARKGAFIMLLNSTKTELGNMVSGIGCELTSIAYGEMWTLLCGAEPLTAEQAIKKVIDNEGKAEFVKIIESLLDVTVDYENVNAIQRIIDDISDNNGVVEWADILDILRDGCYIEKYSIWDYFSDCLDIEYHISSNGEFRGVEVCVACGGPHICIVEDSVWGVWGSDSAEYALCRATRNMVYDWGEEMYLTTR